MSTSSIFRVLAFAWQSFWRNIWLSVVTITIIVLAFISINFLIVINIITQVAINVVEDKVSISVYFYPNITEPQVLEVKTYLSSLAQVKDINYISQQQALENFRKEHQNDTIIIESLEELETNPIEATLQVKGKSLSDYPEIIEVLNNSKYNQLISEKNFDDQKVKNYITKIQTLSDNARKIGLLVTSIFILIALLIVFNTIRVAIYTHQQEITIMKLVGATNWFIRSPFLLEAIFYGIIACTISIIIVYPLLNFLQPQIERFFLSNEFNIIQYFNDNFWQIFGLEILVIILLNIISSSIAIRRYLKV
jgi:cell division transport system permease protein